MVDHELDELRREFLTEAREKIKEMKAAASGDSPQDLERLGYLAHQLKGSGGSYGFPEISDQATGIEKAIESFSAENQTAMEARITGLLAEIDRRAQELS